jgi:hypothetical protein
MTRSREDVSLVLDLSSRYSPSEIAHRTGIPRATIRRWIKGQTPKRTGSAACMRCTPERFSVFSRLTEFAYSYLLGLYLGDGHLASHRRGVFRLVIVMDRKYPRLIAECEAAMSLVVPSNRVAVRPRVRERAVDVGAYSRHWPCLFPQHGPGRKHDRRIALADWQRSITDRYPHRLVRGLIHSDGCRGMNTIRHPEKIYAYPRYQFCNHSADIRELFCEYCDKLGIAWRQMNRFTISVARAGSVARLDAMVGPKR